MAFETRSIRHAKQDRAELDQSITQLRSEGREILGAGTVTPAQHARISTINAELDRLTASAATVAGEVAAFEKFADEERNSGTLGATSPIVSAGTGRTFREMFPHVALSAGGFTNADQFFSALHGGRADDRLVASYGGGLHAGMTVGTDSGGGFQVPTQFLAGLLDSSLESEVVRPRATVVMTSEAR